MPATTQNDSLAHGLASSCSFSLLSCIAIDLQYVP
jgi:hypothetical protein